MIRHRDLQTELELIAWRRAHPPRMRSWARRLWAELKTAIPFPLGRR